ncbi:MAG: hypothetical protein AB1411_16545 [Nitrospirota bacterium]
MKRPPQRLPCPIVEWQAKSPYKTWGLHVTVLNARQPAWFEEFRQAGWTITVSPYSVDQCAQEAMIHKPGTDLFSGWTKVEAARFLAEAERILRKHGLTKVPNRRLTPADLL